MRARLVAAATLITLAAPFALAGAQSAPPPQQGAPAAEPGTHQRAQDAIHSESGRAGKQEPLPATTGTASSQPPAPEPPFVNGRLNVPGAPDSQTVPAKFSARNAAIDGQPILGFLQLTEAQQRAIADGVKAANAPVASLDAKVTEELAASVALQELPLAIHEQMPQMRDFKYVRLEGRILLVYAPNRFVVGEIKG